MTLTEFKAMLDKAMELGMKEDAEKKDFAEYLKKALDEGIVVK